MKSVSNNEWGEVSRGHSTSVVANTLGRTELQGKQAMNVTESGFKNRQLHMEDYLQMVSAEQREYLGQLFSTGGRGSNQEAIGVEKNYY